MADNNISLDSLKVVRSRAAAVFAGFTSGQKVLSLLAAAGLVMGGAFFVKMESAPNYQPLFTNLQPSDSGAITTQLTTAKVPFQLANGGATIMVPAQDVNKERVALAEQGLPNSGTVGFSTLEKSGITTSQFVQQVEYQQALEGQLQQTIESIQGIQSAQVNLVVPQQSSFAVGNQPPTTASILVDLVPGVTLSGGQVRGIVNLTAAATPGLTTSNVTVVDNEGNVLSSGGTTSDTGASGSAQTATYDTQLAASLQALLNPVVGMGNSAVQVHAVLNFDTVKTTTNGLQLNAKGQPITAQTSTSTSSSKGTGTAPASGTLNSTTTATTSTGGNYTQNSKQVTNAVGQVTETVDQAPGQVVSTSIAVLLNSKALSATSLANVKSMISAAAGLNLKKGDQLVVTSMPFTKVAAAKVTSGGSMMTMLLKAGKALGLVLLILAMLFLALRASKKTTYDEIPVGDVSFGGAPRLSALEGESLELPAAPRPLTALDAAPDAVITQVNHFIEQRPSEVARLLRVWADEQGRESV